MTVYTTFVDDGAHGLSVMSLADEDLPFFNCPMPLCEYHIPTFHYVNLYHNFTIKHPMSVSHGFKVSPRTTDTRPFRTTSQVADLAITLDIAEDERQEPPVMASQVDDKAQTAEKQTVQEQASQAIDHEDSQGGAAVTPVADTV